MKGDSSATHRELTMTMTMIGSGFNPVTLIYSDSIEAPENKWYRRAVALTGRGHP